MNLPGEPIISHEVMINLIANTRTNKEFSVVVELDSR